MNLAEALKNRKVQIAIAAIAIVVALALTITFLVNNRNNSDNTTAETSPTAASSPAESNAVAETTQTDPQACSALDEVGFIPERYTIEKVGVDDKVVSLGNTEDNAIAAPPKDEPNTAAWWNLGPAPASNTGQVILSIHTYRDGGAVGNLLYEGGVDQLAPGDVLKLYSADGRVACYEYVSSAKHDAATFDTDSDLMVRYDGDPSLIIIICWDFIADTEDWASRIFFTFKPIVE